MNAAEEARFEPGEVIVSGTAGTIVDKATKAEPLSAFFIMKVMVRCLRLARNSHT